MIKSYLIFVIFFTLAKFFENKIYTQKRQFFALNLNSKFTPARKIYTDGVGRIGDNYLVWVYLFMYHLLQWSRV